MARVWEKEISRYPAKFDDYGNKLDAGAPEVRTPLLFSPLTSTASYANSFRITLPDASLFAGSPASASRPHDQRPFFKGPIASSSLLRTARVFSGERFEFR